MGGPNPPSSCPKSRSLPSSPLLLPAPPLWPCHRPTSYLPRHVEHMPGTCSSDVLHAQFSSPYFLGQTTTVLFIHHHVAAGYLWHRLHPCLHHQRWPPSREPERHPAPPMALPHARTSVTLPSLKRARSRWLASSGEHYVGPLRGSKLVFWRASGLLPLVASDSPTCPSSPARALEL